MLCVTFTALVQRLIAMVKAISNAAAVTIPLARPLGVLCSLQTACS